jgi:hypothetical protein
LSEYWIDAAELALPERATVTLNVPTFSATEYVVALNLKAIFFGAADAEAGTTAKAQRTDSRARARVTIAALSAARVVT